MNNSIYPCVWCNNKAKEMAEFYSEIFPETKIIDENPVVVLLEMFGQKLMLLNGGDIFKPNPTISLMYLSMNADEIDRIWNKLSDGGSPMMPLNEYPFSPKYGWVVDKYGLSWQLYTAVSESHIVQKLVPTLMFTGKQNGNAEKAADFYTSLFPNSAIRGMLRYPGDGGEVQGNIQHGEFLIHDYLFMLMDSSNIPDDVFTEGVSLVVECDYQEEIDNYWEVLTSNGGEESRCGWLKDQFGVSWQIVPRQLGEWMAASPKVTEELFKMGKLDMNVLENASKN